MKNTLLIYGIFLGVLVFILKITEYWFWIKLNAFDVYIILIAIIFLGVGLWLGLNLRQKNKENSLSKTSQIEEEVPSDGYALTQSGISKREHEVLVLIAKGMSNQEIANTLFVSQNTVKTHTSRLFEKLAVKNRTHAIVKAKALGIIGA